MVTRTCSTPIAKTMVSGSTPIGTSPTTSGMTTGRSCSRSPQISSFLPCFDGGVLFSNRLLFFHFPLPSSKHFAHFIQRKRQGDIFLIIQRIGFPQDHQ